MATITYIVNPAGAATVTGPESVNSGQAFRWSVSLSEGYISYSVDTAYSSGHKFHYDAGKDPGGEIMPSNATWVKVTFTATLAKYTITYSKNGGTGTMSSVNVTYGTKYSVLTCAFTKEGYKFAGWKWNNTTYQPGAEIYPKSNITFTAIWVAKSKYTVSYDANGGEGSMSSVPVTEGNKYVIEECGFTATGYKFVEWRWNGSTYQPKATIYPTENMTFKAMWAEDTDIVYVTYDPNGGMMTPVVDTIKSGQAISSVRSAFPVASRNSYRLLGWKKSDGTYANLDDTVTEDKTLTAAWESTGSSASAGKLMYDEVTGKLICDC